MKKERIIIPMVFIMIYICVLGVVSYSKSVYESKPTLNVLMFHVVCDEMPEDKSLSTLYITKERLKEYCEYFKNQGYNVVSLKEAYDIINGKSTLENNNLLVYTFDDGYEDNYTKGFSILKENNIKFNINIIARYTDEKYPNYLTWDQVKKMNESGLLELGNHTYDSHIYTNDINGKSVPILKALLPNETQEIRRNRILNDIEKADELISKNGEGKINIMAYPYGVPPKDMQEEISSKFNYNIELMVTEGVNREIDDFKSLNRFIVDGFESANQLETRMKFYKGINFLNKRARSIG